MKELPLAITGVCSLDAVSMAEQGRRYAELGHHVRDATREPRLLVAQFDEGVDLALLEETVAVERSCCSFFGIEVQGLRLRLTVAEDRHISALDAIAGALGV
ncbi:MAG: hypothetical protein AVDCRST_MAG85-3976 [uncultured Solirubrobacteraceae bacterium]|uniref:Uncharacterized protein n=1 Tax=uncultured Solirubrobacteraceae bacterium TaxID=1162706 RepID=A0A6J4TZN5_9ACTN|nr:MAG: hypothetical protein AVDCRST_MAG85-3976 [uncultured Solirubrobacteraceae bacterium]